MLTRSAHGRRTAVSGSYGYLVKVTKAPEAELRDGLLLTRIQLNPRTLPELKAGRNELIYTAGPAVVRRTVAPDTFRRSNARYLSDGAQGYWVPAGKGPAEFLFHLNSPDGAPLTEFAAGGRFLDLSGGLAPDKFTAEIRKVAAIPAQNPAASIAWSQSPDGPFQQLWQYDPRLQWKDGVPIDRTLRWPEVDRHAAVSSAHDIYVRYRIRDLALDQFRLAVETKAAPSASPLEVTHIWTQDGTHKTMTQRIPAGVAEYHYSIEIPPGAKVVNEAVVFECK